MPVPGKKIAAARILAVIVVLGAVASVVAWQYQRGRSRDLLETVRGDLRNLAAAQAWYSADHDGSFMPGNARVTTTMQYHGYAPSAGVTVSIAEPASGGWSATATHERAPGKVCGIYVGASPPGPPNPATAAGEPACN
jgi:type II secretory pathway pseudopilin PulG